MLKIQHLSFDLIVAWICTSVTYTVPTISDVYFTVGDDGYTLITFSDMTYTPTTYCSGTLSYSAELANGISLPSCLTLYSSNLTFVLYTDNWATTTY